MNDYGVRTGQIYARSDGAKNTVVVVDAEKYAHVGDAIIRDSLDGRERRIDFFKLAMVRYFLVDDQK